MQTKPAKPEFVCNFIIYIREGYGTARTPPVRTQEFYKTEKD